MTMGMGRFRLSREAIDDGFGLQAFEGMIPIRVESHYNGYLEVTAFSEEFDPCPPGLDPVLYEMQFIGEELGGGRIGNWKRQITVSGNPHERQSLPPYAKPVDPLDFRLKVYPNPMRTDGVFVAEDKEIAPYPGISNADGRPCYPAIPETRYSIGYQLDRTFAEELVRRWNTGAGSTEPGFQ